MRPHNAEQHHTDFANASNLESLSFPHSSSCLRKGLWRIISPGREILWNSLKLHCRRQWDVKKRQKKLQQGGKWSHLVTVYPRSTFMSFHFVLTKLINTTKPPYVTLTSALVGRPVSFRPPDWLMFSFFWKASNALETWKERVVWRVRWGCLEGCYPLLASNCCLQWDIYFRKWISDLQTGCVLTVIRRHKL